MLSLDNYGVVYTPRKVATFVSVLLIDELSERISQRSDKSAFALE